MHICWQLVDSLICLSKLCTKCLYCCALAGCQMLKRHHSIIQVKYMNGILASLDKTNKTSCAPSKDSDQPGHPPSLIRVFAVHSIGSYSPSFLHADSKDSDQTGQMPRLIHVFARRKCHFVGFVMHWLICFLWINSHVRFINSLLAGGPYRPNSLPSGQYGAIGPKCLEMWHHLWSNKKNTVDSRLSQITACLEVKIWSLPKHENLTVKNIFHNIFNISLTSSPITHLFVKCG